jgi:hypothetical protein
LFNLEIAIGKSPAVAANGSALKRHNGLRQPNFILKFA